jgi:hypothetical protein
MTRRYQPGNGVLTASLAMHDMHHYLNDNKQSDGNKPDKGKTAFSRPEKLLSPELFLQIFA